MWKRVISYGLGYRLEERQFFFSWQGEGDVVTHVAVAPEEFLALADMFRNEGPIIFNADAGYHFATEMAEFPGEGEKRPFLEGSPSAGGKPIRHPEPVTAIPRRVVDRRDDRRLKVAYETVLGQGQDRLRFAADFASRIPPERLIGFSQGMIGTEHAITIWYWQSEPASSHLGGSEYGASSSTGGGP